MTIQANQENIRPSCKGLQVFIQPNQRSLPFDQAVSRLDDTLFHLNDVEGDNLYPKKASQYLDDWASGSNAFLRKYYQKGSDIPQLDLTPGSEKAIEWLQTLQPREFIGTESRLLTLHRLLQEIVQNTADDPEERIAELEKQKLALSRLRHYLPHAQTMMMDQDTLKQFGDLCVDEPEKSRCRHALNYLSDTEEALYEYLQLGHQRLEQERIPMEYVIALMGGAE